MIEIGHCTKGSPDSLNLGRYSNGKECVKHVLY